MAQLPDEILLSIVGLLEDEYNQIFLWDDPGFTIIKQTFLSLCLTSRMLCSIAQPILHTKFDKYDNEMDQYTKDDLRPITRYPHFRGFTRTELFTRTLIQRPDLAQNVKAMRLEAFQRKDRPDNFYNIYLPLDSAVADMFVEASSRIPPPHPPSMFKLLPEDDKSRNEDSVSKWQDKWRSELRRGDSNAEVALLLTLVPNVSRLELGSATYDLGEFVDVLCEQMLGPQAVRKIAHHGSQVEVDAERLSQMAPPPPPSILSQLEDLVITTENNWSNLTFEGISCLLTIPTLRRLCATYLDGMPRHSQHTLLQQAYSHLEHVQLNECTFNTEYLSDFINSCTGLKHLDIQFSWNNPIRLGGIFWRSLHKRVKTLESLQLQKYDHEGMTLADRINLDGFTQLQSLTIEQGPQLVIPDTLPNSLKKLSINKCDENVLVLVEQLHDAVKVNRLPNMETFSVVLDHAVIDKDDMDRLQARLCTFQPSLKANGVEFRYYTKF